MSNFFKNFTPLLLVLLKLCISVSGNFTNTDLGIVCAIRVNTKLTTIPQQCTAVAVYSGQIEQLGAVNQMRGELPLLIIVQNIEWDNIDEMIEKGVGEVLNIFQNVGFDYMLFDDSYKLVQIFGGSSAVESYSENLGTFLSQARDSFPGKQFGLVLGHDVNSMEDRVDLSILKDYSDFFLLESTGYRDCGIHFNQADMEVLATRNDIFSSLAGLKKARIPMEKILYTIELKIESRKLITSEDIDYSYLCSNELSNDRKYCFNTIQNLVEKARLRISECTLGIFINGIEFDDYNGACGCKTTTDKDASFRGLKTIAGASLENTNEVSFYECSEGSYPVILNS